MTILFGTNSGIKENSWLKACLNICHQIEQGWNSHVLVSLFVDVIEEIVIYCRLRHSGEYHLLS